MESRRTTRKQAQQQSAGSAAGSPVVHSAKKSVMPTAKKAGSARRTTSRKPLADRTNDSPIYGLTPCGNKTGGGRKSSPIYERTPISKLRSFKSCTPGTPGEEILRSQVQSMLEKVKANEQSMGDALQYYSPLFSSSSAGGSMSQSQYYTPATSFPTVDSQSPGFPLSTKFQEEGLQAQTDMWRPVKSNPELQMEQPLVLATSKDKTCGSEEQEQEDGELLPLDMQLLYVFGKAAAAAPASDSDACDTSSLDLDVLKAVEKVITRMEDEKPEAKGEDKEGCDGGADTDGVSDQTELPNLWKQRGGRSVKITGGSVKVVNAASQETTTNEEYQEYEGNYEADVEEEEGGEYEELCRGISHISMRDSRDGFGPPPFAGRHTRFHYNSEGEIDSVQVDEEEDMEKSPEGPATPTTVMRLRGLPTPKGKHLRFTEDI